MNSTDITLLMWKQRVTKRTTVFGGRETKIRPVYVESDELPAEPEPVLAIVEVSVCGPEAAVFVEFLDDGIERDDAGRITAGGIWAGWAAHRGADPGEDEIGGISRQDASRLFRLNFGEPEQTRARIDGRVQRCWIGYRLNVSD